MAEPGGGGGSSPARFSRQELDGWFQLARDVHLAAPSLVFAAVHWKLNRLTFGLARPDEDRVALAEELVRLGIPPEAVNVEKAQPIRLL
jgi:hypothetical protein